MRTIFKNDLFLVNLLTVLLVLLVALLPSTVLRTAISIPFILFSPGYCLAALLWPAKDTPGNLERVWLSFVLSIAVFPFVGLLLTLTPWGITLNSSLFSLALVIFILSAGAQYRRKKSPAYRRFSLNWRFLSFHWRGKSRGEKVVNAFIAASIVFCLASLSYSILVPNIGERFTEFYILGEDNQTTGYPWIVEQGSELSSTIGIINREGEREDYRVQVMIGDKQIGQELQFTLDNYDKTEQTISFPLAAKGQQRVNFFLYKGDSPQPYRETYLWLDVKASGEPYTIFRAYVDPSSFARWEFIFIQAEIENHQSAEASYELHIRESWSGESRRVSELGIIKLADGQRWRGTFYVMMTFAPELSKEQLDIMLFKPGEDQPQQVVSLPLFAEESR